MGKRMPGVHPAQPAQVTWQNRGSIYTAELAFLLKGESLELRSQKESQLFQVLKADGDEMILKRGETVYYLKRFAKG